jgi:iron only hydrogenase large subunit-like protein
MNEPISLVKTIRERCRVCYTCVRECPAKAIRIADGQAEVIPERCIGCGNCVQVCSQNAKLVLNTKDKVRAILNGQAPVAACVAPSFPAEFTDMGWETFVGLVRALGFSRVCEVGFGADLVARRYRKLLAETNDHQFIATTCPAIVAYVERYAPDLVPHLAPVVSPMVAEARALRRIYGPGLRLVFIGPCLAKKGEAANDDLPAEMDAVITFIELREMLAESGLAPATAVPSDFDPPHAGAGGLFSVSRGFLQAAEIREDLLAGEVVATEGRTHFIEALKEFQSGDLKTKLLEILCCNGCIMGAGMSTKAPQFGRRSRVGQYVRQRLAKPSGNGTLRVEDFDDLDLGRTFSAKDQRLGVPFEEEIRQIMANMGKLAPEDELNCGACGYDTCHEHAAAIFKGLAEIKMCLPHTIDQLSRTVDQLASAQEALMQSEKLANMGQLAAGIAHEVNNPLGVVLMYAHLLRDQYQDNPEMSEDLTTIAEQADRCKKIIAGLLHFARQNKVVLQDVDLRDLIDRSLKSLRVPDHIGVEVKDTLADPVAELDGDQIIQVLTNLITNSVAAMDSGGRLTVGLSGDDEVVRLTVADTGIGIRPENLPKIFEPFFTTKQIGKGTGLGLSVTYGIVKIHRGEIRVESNADPAAGATGTTFTVTLPRRGRRE